MKIQTRILIVVRSLVLIGAVGANGATATISQDSVTRRTARQRPEGPEGQNLGATKGELVL
ncbi:MAG: hypothetical protein KAU10_07325 [Dehalococcoidia bacterium]|nr:hypothetical protein [Dehalococcoidia bacterium]